MVDLIAIKGAIDGLKAARDIAKTAIDLRDATLLQDKVIELNDAILSAQSSALDAQADQLAMANRIDDLERQIAQFEAWEAQKKRYKLTDFGGGTFAYELQPGMENGEDPHRACANCFEKGHRSVLQFKSRTVFQQDRYACPACNSEFDFGVRHNPPRPSVQTRRGPGSWMGS